MIDKATVQTMHPQWNIVDIMEAPNGGIWALGADGGVFALDATGGTTGITAPFYGSYTKLPAEQRQGARTFQRIESTPQGGYQIVSNNQEVYGQGGAWGPAPVQQTQAGPTNTAGTQQATDTTPTAALPNLSGTAALHAVLDPIGLGSMVPDALAALNQPGADVNWVTQVWIPQQQAYKDAFPEIAAAQAKIQAGAPTHIPTPADIVNYRQTATEMVNQGLLPPEFVTRDKISGLINGGVSLAEFQDRVLNGVDQFLNADPADQQAFMAYHPAVDFSHAVGALLDPTLNEAAVNRAITQAKIGGSAIRSGFGSITGEQATALQQAGQGSASQFTRAAMENPLTQALVGETPDISRQTQLEAIGGSATAQQALETRRSRRQAAFQGGGGAATGGSGKTGLG